MRLFPVGIRGFVARHWPWLPAFLLQAQSIINSFAWLLDQRSRYDAFTGSLKDMGGPRNVIGYLLNPPPWFYLVAFVAGLVLIYWDTRRNRKRDGTLAGATRPAGPDHSTPTLPQNVSADSSRISLLDMCSLAQQQFGWDMTGTRDDPYYFSQALRQAASDGHITIYGREIRKGSDMKSAPAIYLLSAVPPLYFKDHWIDLLPAIRERDNCYTQADFPVKRSNVFFSDLHANRLGALAWLRTEAAETMRSVRRPQLKQMKIGEGNDMPFGSAEVVSAVAAPQFIFGKDLNYETNTANGLYKTNHLYRVGVKNVNVETFLSNCKLSLLISNQTNQIPVEYSLLGVFTLNASEERYVEIVSYDEPATVSGYAGKYIRLHIPASSGALDVGIGWPWQLPVGAYVLMLRVTCKEAGAHEQVCKISIDQEKRLRFAAV